MNHLRNEHPLDVAGIENKYANVVRDKMIPQFIIVLRVI